MMAVSAACLSLGACKLPFVHDKAPTGQVVATYNGQEVTVRDLALEMGNAKTSTPAARKQAEMAALNNILGRKIIAQAAIDQGLDKTPEFALQKQKAIDEVLAQSLEAKIAAQVPAPTKEEAQNFVAEHPDIFSQRKIFLVDQIRTSRPADPSVLKAYEPLKTMDEVEAQLTKDKLPFQKGEGEIDAVGADPKMIDEIVKLPPGEIFIMPSGNGLLVNQIRQTQVIPFTGDPAVQYAQALLTRERTQDAVQRQLHTILGKAAGSVKFNKDYAPTKLPPAATPPAKS